MVNRSCLQAQLGGNILLEISRQSESLLFHDIPTKLVYYTIGGIMMEQVLYKKKYSIVEGYRLFVDGMRTLKDFRFAKKNGHLSKAFEKRIMLAVTEVNGCEICSYEHTKSALEMGMSQEEIHQLLTGQTENCPPEESKAIFFAQHYAETKGYPSEAAWREIQKHYQKETAMGILGAIRLIMIGNSFGIAFSAFKSRLRGKKIESSSLGYELSMMFSLLFIFPIGSVHALLENLAKKPLLSST